MVLPTPTGQTEPLTRWARAAAATREVAFVADVLRARGISIMPLKGVELVARYGREPTERAFVDADLLIEPPHFARAIRVLREAGFRQVQEGWSARSMRSPFGFISLDVHRLLLPPLMGKLSPIRVFERGRRDRRGYGAEVVRMDPNDFFVHLLCHYLVDRLPGSRSEVMIDDLRAVARAVTPWTVRDAATGAGVLASSWLTLDHILTVSSE